ncbi:hypothetical protein LJC46_00335 [Desulfovibrio sp. OttesenSCG-928-G15]|nr:hypothetical protein [Desulfovibrio sp. OttesenSCG-928-G15]
MHRPVFARLLLLLFVVFSLAACAGHKASVPAAPEPPKDTDLSGDKASRIWQKLVSRAKSAEFMKGPFRISATLRYTGKDGKNTRVSSLLWGNGKAESPYPLRLDLLAGVGTVVAKVREDEIRFVVFAPEEKTAYVHEGSAATLSSFGVPIPLSLSDLTLILTGRGGLLFLPEANESRIPEDRKETPTGAHFIVANAKLAGELEVSEQGAPLEWHEINRDGWTIIMEPGEKDPLIPQKLRISHTQGYSALITIKEIARVSPPFTKAQLDLPLPPGTTEKPIGSK